MPEEESKHSNPCWNLWYCFLILVRKERRFLQLLEILPHFEISCIYMKCKIWEKSLFLWQMETKIEIYTPCLKIFSQSTYTLRIELCGTWFVCQPQQQWIKYRSKKLKFDHVYRSPPNQWFWGQRHTSLKKKKW